MAGELSRLSSRQSGISEEEKIDTDKCIVVVVVRQR